jgi:uncharacterized membrane protein YfcA
MGWHTQHKETGTRLTVLLTPIRLAAALEYDRHGNVDIRAAVILASTMIIGTSAGPTSQTGAGGHA